jgi:hypothetical protein
LLNFKSNLILNYLDGDRTQGLLFCLIKNKKD